MILSTIIGLSYGIIVAILKYFLKKNKYFKIAGILLLLGIIGFAWYSSLVTAATIGEAKSNEWAIQFCCSCGLDYFAMQLM